MLHCPYCGIKAKDCTRQWNYRHFTVKYYQCPKCKTKFGIYYKSSEFSHVIDGKMRIDNARILKFLKTNKKATTEQIAVTLNLKVERTARLLALLKKRGIIGNLNSD